MSSTKLILLDTVSHTMTYCEILQEANQSLWPSAAAPSSKGLKVGELGAKRISQTVARFLQGTHVLSRVTSPENLQDLL
jgi:hypothetical protein